MLLMLEKIWMDINLMEGSSLASLPRTVANDLKK